MKTAASNNAQIDRQIESSSGSVDSLMKRVFYPEDTTRVFDWPNFQMAYPWRLWLDNNELAAAPTAVTSGGVTIPLSSVIPRPVNNGPPFTHIELDRSKNDAFGHGSTPQKEIAITGTFGYWNRWALTGALGQTVVDATSNTIVVSVGGDSGPGVGDTIRIDSERMIVTDNAFTPTGVTFLSGCTTASASDNIMVVPDGAKFAAGEVILIDSEALLVLGILGNNLMVKRGWDGTTLAIHPQGPIAARRMLTVLRGVLGTTAAPHADAAGISTLIIPGLIKELAVAEAVVSLTQETGAWSSGMPVPHYGGTTGGQVREPAPGAGLPDLRERACKRYGRIARQRVI